MIWYRHMFLGKKCRKRAERLKGKIAGRQKHTGVYLIVLSENEHALLEVIPSMLLMQKAYPLDGLRVVGMASSRQEAIALVEKIIGEVFRNGGDVNEIASYLEQYR